MTRDVLLGTSETPHWQGLHLPARGIGREALGWQGVMTAIVTEGALFLFLLFCYYYIDLQLGARWRPPIPEFKVAGANTIVLLLSSIAVWFAEHGARRHARGRILIGLGVAFVLGTGFVAVQAYEWLSKPYSLTSSLYGSVYFVITGFHMAHVVLGALALAALFFSNTAGPMDAGRQAPVMVGAAYWHFVDAVWLAVFATFYITPRLW